MLMVLLHLLHDHCDQEHGLRNVQMSTCYIPCISGKIQMHVGYRRNALEKTHSMVPLDVQPLSWLHTVELAMETPSQGSVQQARPQKQPLCRGMACTCQGHAIS